MTKGSKTYKKMNSSIWKSSPKGNVNKLLKILAVIAVVALLMTTKVVSDFTSNNIIKNARPEDISGTAEDILYVISGVIIFIVGGFVLLPFFKIAIMAVGIWLAYKGLKSLYDFFLR